MRLAWCLSFVAIASAVGLAAACGGKPGGTTGDGGGGVNGGPCDDFFTAIYGGGCENPAALPASEIARLRGRYDQACASELGLPGIGVDTSALEACASAIKASGCSVIAELNGPCSFAPTGTLASGSACATDAQCLGGDCSAGSLGLDGGTEACGMCAPLADLGQPCTGDCVKGASCVDMGATETCVAITYGAAGVKCDAQQNQCNSGLVCNLALGACATPGATGTSCLDQSDCQAGLACPSVGGPGTCESPAQSGGPCEYDQDCVPPLGCDDDVHQCATITFASAGQACSGSVKCLVGTCPTGTTGGTCPAVVADGQPCTDQSTCDTFALCAGGTCRLGYAGVCP
jgi:hypothetical protein